MTGRGAASRYAEALFGHARDLGTLEPVRSELRELVRAVDATPELKGLLARPDLDPQRKLAALRLALGERFSGLMLALLAALVRRQRGRYLAQVAEAFEELADEAAGVVRAETESATPLTPEQQERLIRALAHISGRRVLLSLRVNPELLAGVRVKVGDRLIDGSGAGRLARMRQELTRWE